MSLFYLIGLFDLWDGIRTIAISAGGAYAISAYIKGPYMPWIGFVFLMGHMSINHIYRQILDDPGIIDITGKSTREIRGFVKTVLGAQMVLVMKVRRAVLRLSLCAFLIPLFSLQHFAGTSTMASCLKGNSQTFRRSMPSESFPAC